MSDPLACPSARAETGNLLLGRVDADGLQRLGAPLPVDQGFVEAVARNGPAERRFRFAGRCVEGACAQWTGQGCGVVERAVATLAAPADGPLPRCFLRASCRWFAQRGAAACAVCGLVVTDQREAVRPPALSPP
jgi:hypothetical protein